MRSVYLPDGKVVDRHGAVLVVGTKVRFRKVYLFVEEDRYKHVVVHMGVGRVIAMLSGPRVHIRVYEPLPTFTAMDNGALVHTGSIDELMMGAEYDEEAEHHITLESVLGQLQWVEAMGKTLLPGASRK